LLTIKFFDNDDMIPSMTIYEDPTISLHTHTIIQLRSGRIMQLDVEIEHPPYCPLGL
jgi:hypothetical protein